MFAPPEVNALHRARAKARPVLVNANNPVAVAVATVVPSLNLVAPIANQVCPSTLASNVSVAVNVPSMAIVIDGALPKGKVAALPTPAVAVVTACMGNPAELRTRLIAHAPAEDRAVAYLRSRSAAPGRPCDSPPCGAVPLPRAPS